MSINPYRNAFYQRQSEWHDITDLHNLRLGHEKRVPYYKWYTKTWLPDDKNTPILDVGCGSGQFVYFLKLQGYNQVTGIDLDVEQVNLAQRLNLECKTRYISEYLQDKKNHFGMISMLDIIEHFTMAELYPIMETVAAALTPGGRVIASVPNAVSPVGLSTRYSDITHECGFSPTSLSQLFFCHHMKIAHLRDPWPAPVSPTRKIYRIVAEIARKFEGFRMKLLGMSPPQHWSPVIWAVAIKK